MSPSRGQRQEGDMVVKTETWWSMERQGGGRLRLSTPPYRSQSSSVPGGTEHARDRSEEGRIVTLEQRRGGLPGRKPLE